MIKKILLLLLVILIIIQFIRPAKNVSSGPQPNSILAAYPASPQVKGILERACFDCHSNNTNYPWYSRMQPVAWWLNDHIEEGKHELNFDEFMTYTAKKQDKKLEEVIEMVKEGEMPLKSYTVVHKDARLTPEERSAITDWAAGLRQRLPVQQESE